jgi:hypothetical protein
MSKLKLLTRVLNAELKAPELSDDQRIEVIEKSLREYAAEVLNKLQFFRDRNVEENTLKEFFQLEDLDFNLKTKKFF